MSDEQLPKHIQSAFATTVTLHNQSYVEAARSPLAWWVVAERLQRASELLMPHDVFELMMANVAKSVFAKDEQGMKAAGQEAAEHMAKYAQLDPVALMLLGMSFECLLKGIMIANDPSLVLADKLHKTVETHNLQTLSGRVAAKGGIALSIDEVSLMHPMLTELIYWGGRYPIPTHPSDLIEQFGHSSQTMDGLRTLWQKLGADLRLKIPS